MTNIYEVMLHFKNTKEPNWGMTPWVSSKLASLLQQATGIELQGDGAHFAKNISVCGLRSFAGSPGNLLPDESKEFDFSSF